MKPNLRGTAHEPPRPPLTSQRKLGPILHLAQEDEWVPACAGKSVDVGRSPAYPAPRSVHSRRPTHRLSSPRRRGPNSHLVPADMWVPACAGMTVVDARKSGRSGTKSFAGRRLRILASPSLFLRLIPVLRGRVIIPPLRRHRATRDERAMGQDRGCEGRLTSGGSIGSCGQYPVPGVRRRWAP